MPRAELINPGTIDERNCQKTQWCLFRCKPDDGLMYYSFKRVT